MKCCYKSSSILSTKHHPFLYKQPISSLPPSPASFPSTLSYPTRTRFTSTRIQSRLIHDDPVKQSSQDLTFYDLLGVTDSVTLPEIKQAYKQLARKYHPDVSPPDRVEEYTDRFIKVQEAYETLSDPRRRVLYDRDLSMGFSFSFSGRRCNRYDEEVVEEKSEWKAKWQTQLSGLRRRSNQKDNDNSISWAARMRRQRQDSS
ncbi:PREDICTED: chaperone protein dnaJ 20, chloroplastic-like [Camelina sativa]|uniref:Chaperone protein dnaJ 20, chloroplastic-like n=1 Tax=Camelina sativa TaxID=90675 RepID=A0ABM0Y5G3_CAMSA|nr:PREDICTED: chaperone protein dnaJ 20, chloroplastic-like [Camelina sativa]